MQPAALRSAATLCRLVPGPWQQRDAGPASLQKRDAAGVGHPLATPRSYTARSGSAVFSPVTTPRQLAPSPSLGVLPAFSKERPKQRAAVATTHVCGASMPTMKTATKDEDAKKPPNMKTSPSPACTTATPAGSCKSPARGALSGVPPPQLRSSRYIQPYLASKDEDDAKPPEMETTWSRASTAASTMETTWSRASTAASTPPSSSIGPDGKEDTWPPTGLTDPFAHKVQCLETQLHKASGQLQHQQKMVKQLLQHLETERGRRHKLEDALADGCLCSCCEQSKRDN